MKRLFLLAMMLLIPAAVAKTECYPAMSPECTIHIHINIAFSYNDSEISQQQIDAWVKEIEDVWNGPLDYQTYGDCECKVKFQVNAIKVTEPGEVNCTPGPQGYHCVMVTDHNRNQPKNEAGNETYRGYMYGVSKNGSSVNGWWSNEMGEPHPDSPTGENALDAAHEAGHMLGLGDDYDKGPPERHGKNIMGTTHGEDAQPTQEQIDRAVENVCPEGCCPDDCCCGNGVVEEDRGEACDPLADPNGCGGYENLYCCKICCQCHQKACMPELGSYATDDDCKAACKNGSCYLNYDTGCWDCKEHNIVVTPTPGSSEPAPPAEPAAPEDTGAAQPEGPDSGVLGITGVVAVVLGGGFIVGGMQKKNKSALVGGSTMALIGFLILVALVVNAAIHAGPIGVTRPASPGPQTRPVPSMVSLWELPGPEPEPAENPKEEVLKVKKNATGGGCGDGVCGEGEWCNCSDCACDEGEYCNPYDGNADEKGCSPFSCGEMYVYKPDKPPAGEPEDCGLVMSWGDRCSPGYTTQSDCDAKCKPEGNIWRDCLLNYQTNCWDCVEYARRGGGFVCGDRKCSVTENCSTCPSDCGRCPYCGDNKCLGSETCSNCKKDCGSCPPVCGDGDCEGAEDCESCGDDCGECKEEPECGDGVCEGDEDCDSCGDDCGECGPECGNDMCEVGENCECSDCGCPVGLYCNPEFPDADPMGCSHFGGPPAATGYATRASTATPAR